MNLLLTGPTGFIGYAVLRLALARGHAVTALLFPGESLRPVPDASRLRVATGALACPPWDELAAEPLDVCLHTAWVTTPGVYLESEANDQFLDWSRRLAEGFFARGGRHFMGLGSCAEYQPTGRPLPEDTAPLSEATRYARCKNALRLAVEQLAAAAGQTAGWGRVFYPFGEGEHPARLCSSLIRQMASGEPVTLRTPGSTKDYIYIEDLAWAIVLALEHGFTGTLNLGTGCGVTVRDMARHLAACLGCPALVREADPPAHDPLDFLVADATRLRSLGWEDQVGLKTGLERLCRHLTATPPTRR